MRRWVAVMCGVYSACIFLFPFSTYAQSAEVLASQASGTTCASVPGVIAGTSNAANLASNVCDYARENKDSVVAQINMATAIGFKNALSFFLKTMASDAATRLATAGEGQTPLLDQRPVGTVLLNAADGAAGTFINDLTSAFGVNLCSPDLNVKLRISLGLRGFAQPVAPRCTLSELGRNWRDWAVQMRDDPQGFLQSVADVGFDVQGQDLGIALDAQSQILQNRAIAERTATLQQSINGNFRNVESKISGWILTPGTQVRRQVEQSTIDGPGAAWAYTGDAVADGIDAFTNTLAQQLMQRMMRGLVGLFSGGDDVQLAQFDAQFGSAGRVARIAEVNSQSLIAPVIKVENYNLLQLYALCPDVQNPGLNNCVIDSKFKQAIDQKLTVKQAIDQKLLNPDWVVGYTDIASGKEPSYTEGFGYNNIKKLRFARVVPVGWELAATKARELGEVKTLGQLITEFSKSGDDGKCTGAGASPYCGLVDPSWVLRAFPMQCDAQTYGTQLTSAGTRELTCTDLKTCVKEDGTACQAYGYCLRERNTWKFDADSCRAEFASCQTFTRASDASQVSYIVSTVDKSVCNAANAGCRGYALEKGANQQWKIGKDDKIAYINSQAPACDAQDAGCGELVRLRVDFVNIPDPTQTLASKFPSGYDSKFPRVTLKQPPAWLGCTGLANDRSECAGYAQVCNRSEVGCERYTPTDGSPAVAGTITQNDICPAQCVGYSSFVQLPTVFESTLPAPVAFIPSTARKCSAEAVGCSEFTNVGAGAGQGGEIREYYTSTRACRKPTDAERTGELVLDTTYYTWEGAADTGFQLKTWRLEKSDRTTNSEGGQGGTGNAPCTNFDVESNRCNDINARWIGTDLPLSSCKDSYKPGQEGHNSDCREFFDKGGRIFYREYLKTVVVTADCVTLRKSGVASKDECVGGTFANGVCLYNTYRPESGRCDASQNECRAYKGNTGNNVQVIMDDSFEGDLSELAYKAAAPNVGSILPSGVALNRGGKSLSFTGSNIFIKTPLAVGGVTSLDAYTLQITLLTDGSAQATGIKLATVQNKQVTSMYSFLNRVVGTGWKSLTLNGDLVSPERVDQVGADINVPDGVYLFVSRPDDDATIRFIDSIRLTKAQDFQYLIRNSWNTPAACDATNGGVPLRGAQIGCREYKTRDNKVVDLKSFTKLCDAGKVGCEAFADTKNTPELGAVVVGAGTGTATEKGRYVVPADELKYFVYTGERGTGTCVPAKNGCTELGLITYDTASTRAPQSAQSVYKILLPEKYGSTLCTGTGTASELFCEEYKRGGTSTYFKSPEGKTCEYRDDFGWVKQGTTQPCEGRATRTVLAAAGGADYKQWVGVCPSDQDSCKKFVDPTDGANGVYYYKENKRLEELRASCNGKVSQKEGCVLFYDALLLQKPYNASASYAASDKARGGLVAPVANASGDTNTIIRVTRDRECSLWGACRSWTRDQDGAIICGDYAGCTQLTGNGDITTCGEFVGPADRRVADQVTYASVRANFRFEYDNENLSGYSIPGAYPFLGLKQVKRDIVPPPDTQRPNTCDTSTGRCGLSPLRQCLSDRDCAQEILLGRDGQQGGIAQTCRAYPEASSPALVPTPASQRQNLRDCKNGICECSYRVYSAGGVSGAYPLTTSVPRICANGDPDTKGKACRTDEDCTSSEKVVSGSCVSVDSVQDQIGVYGYCLDKEGKRNDGREPGCITWYPGVLTQGKASTVFNAFSAEYRAPVGKEYYCKDVKTPEPLSFYAKIWYKDASGGTNLPNGFPLTVDVKVDGGSGPDPAVYSLVKSTPLEGVDTLINQISCEFPNPSGKIIELTSDELNQSGPKNGVGSLTDIPGVVDSLKCTKDTCVAVASKDVNPQDGFAGIALDSPIDASNCSSNSAKEGKCAVYQFIASCIGAPISNGIKEATFYRKVFQEAKQRVVSSSGGGGPVDWANYCPISRFNNQVKECGEFPCDDDMDVTNTFVSDEMFKQFCVNSANGISPSFKSNCLAPLGNTPIVGTVTASGYNAQQNYQTPWVGPSGAYNGKTCTFKNGSFAFTFRNVWHKDTPNSFYNGSGANQTYETYSQGFRPTPGVDEVDVPGVVSVNIGLGADNGLIPGFFAEEGKASGQGYLLSDYFDNPVVRAQSGAAGTSISSSEILDEGNCDQVSGRFCRVPGIGIQGAGFVQGGLTDYRVLGCYVISPPSEQSGGDKKVFYPWKSSAPNLYEEQIASIEIEYNHRYIGSKDAYYSAGGYGYECSTQGDDLLETAGTLRLEQGSWSDSVSNEGNSYDFQAVFDTATKRLSGIQIGYAGDESKTLFVSGFKINFKPACASFVRVSDPTNLERVVGDSDRLKRPDLYTAEIKNFAATNSNFGSCVPWGPIAYDADRPTVSPAYTLVTNIEVVPNGVTQCQERRGARYFSGSSAVPLSTLFRKSYGVWDFARKDGNDYRYMYGKPETPNWFVRKPTNSQSGAPTASSLSGGSDPVVYAYNDGSRGAAGALSVNGVTGGDVILPAGGGAVTMRFYGVANKSQMPLRSVSVYFGPQYFGSDPTIQIGDEQALTTSIKNRDAICNGLNFAGDTRACIESPFVFSHTYFCEGQGSLPVCQSNGGIPPQQLGCYVSNLGGSGKGACVYTPGVRIMDNWSEFGTATFGGRVIVPVQ